MRVYYLARDDKSYFLRFDGDIPFFSRLFYCKRLMFYKDAEILMNKLKDMGYLTSIMKME